MLQVAPQKWVDSEKSKAGKWVIGYSNYQFSPRY